MTAYRLSRAFNTPKRPVGHSGACRQLPEGTDWPTCGVCGDAMEPFFDLALPEDADPFVPGSVLQVFQCATHDDVPGTPYSGIVPFLEATGGERLPPEFWTLTDGHYALRLLPPDTPLAPMDHESALLEAMHVSAKPIKSAKADGLKLFGLPRWVQAPEEKTCACGAPMALALQVPEDFHFTSHLDSPRYRMPPLLFNGNAVYLLACTEACDPRAVWPVVQN